jgi:type I restriction enzyme S subunit
MRRWPTEPLLDTAELTATRVGAFTGQRRYVSTGDANEKGIAAAVFVTFEDRPSRADLAAREGDVLFARMQATNRVIIVTKENEDYLWSTGFAALRPRPGTNTRWLAFWLASPLFNARKDALCTGATQKAITNDGIRKLEIPLPPPAEQERIVRILEGADVLRRLRAMASHRTSDIAQALFSELVEPTGTEWRSSRLENLCRNIEDCPHSTPIYSEGTTPFPCVRSSDIQDGRFDWSTTKYVDEAEYQERVRRLVPRFGDVVYCREGARLGNAAIVP